MADKTAQIKVTIKNDAAKAGIKGIGDETKRTAQKMKEALSGALDDGMKAGKSAIGDMLSSVKSAVGTIGGLMGGIGLAELIQGGLEANTKIGALTFGLRAAGGTARDAVGVMKQLRQASLETAQDSMKMIDVFEGIRGETGSIDYATDSIEDVATAARGAHKDIEQMGAIAGTLNEKFGIEAGDDLRDTLADVVGLSEKGGVGFDDMAQKLGLIGAYAKEAGLQGREGFGQIVGLLNMADNANGNFKKGITAVGGLLEQLGNASGRNKIGAALGISGKDMSGNAAQQIEAIMRATKGQKSQLEKAFGGEQLKLLVDMGKTYAAAFNDTKGSVKAKSEAAAAALRNALSDAGKSAVTWADIQTEAAAQMKEAPQQVAVATEKLRQAFQSEKFQAALASVIDKLPALAEWIAKIAGWTIDNPGAAITAAILGSIAKAAIGEAVGSALGGIFKAFPGATIGVGLLASAATAAAIAIADYEAKKTANEQGLQSTAAVAAKAKKQLLAKGELDEETFNELARKRADFEAVRAAANGEAGVEPLTYTQILAAKITGGADELAGAEAITEEAQRLGPEGVQKQIDELDALLYAAKPARAKPVPFGPEAPDPMGDAMAYVANMPAMEPGAPGGAAAPAGPGGGGGGAAAPQWDPQVFATAMGNSVAGKELRVRVTNPNDIGGSSAPTGAGATTPGRVAR